MNRRMGRAAVAGALAAVAMVVAQPGAAQVVTDGTLGRAAALAGPNFAVTADQLDVGRYLARVGASSEGTAHGLQAAGAAAPAAAGGQAAAPELRKPAATYRRVTSSRSSSRPSACSSRPS